MGHFYGLWMKKELKELNGEVYINLTRLMEMINRASAERDQLKKNRNEVKK